MPNTYYRCMHKACYNRVQLTSVSQNRGAAESPLNLCCTQAFVRAVHNSIMVICLLSLVSQFTAAISYYSVLANAKCSVQFKVGWFILFKPATIIDNTAFNNPIETILSQTGCIRLAHDAVQQASLLRMCLMAGCMGLHDLAGTVRPCFPHIYIVSNIHNITVAIAILFARINSGRAVCNGRTLACCHILYLIFK